MSIRIVIADDHPMVINGIRNMLSNYPDMEPVGTFLNAETLLSALPQILPDVLLLDIQLPDKTGDQIVPVITRMYPDIRILVVTNFNSTLYLNNMIRLGIHGYLLKTTEENTLVQAIHALYRGETFIDPALKAKAERETPKVSIYNQVVLTLREKEILQLVAKGKSNQDIVEELFLSINTVKNYLARIFVKLDVKNRAELTRKALQMGIVE